MESRLATDRPFPLTPLLYLSGLLYLNVTGRMIIAPLLPLLEADFRFGHGAAGSLFFVQMTGYAFGLLASSVAVWRFTRHGAIVLSAFGLGAALLALSLASSLMAFRASLILLGAAAGLYLPAGIATITELAAEAERGRAMAVHELAPGIAFITAPLAAEFMLHWLSWRMIFAALGIGLCAAGVVYQYAGHGGSARGEPKYFQKVIALASDPTLMCSAVPFTVAVALGSGLYAMLPLFLTTERALDRPSANILLGLSRLLALPMVFAGGWLADRLGVRRALLASQAAAALATIALAVVPAGRLTGLAVVLQGALNVCFFPPYYARVTQLVGLDERHLAVSVVSMAGLVIGGGLGPALVGQFAERWSFAGATLLLGAAGLGSTIFLTSCGEPRGAAGGTRT